MGSAALTVLVVPAKGHLFYFFFFGPRPSTLAAYDRLSQVILKHSRFINSTDPLLYMKELESESRPLQEIIG